MARGFGARESNKSAPSNFEAYRKLAEKEARDGKDFTSPSGIKEVSDFVKGNYGSEEATAADIKSMAEIANDMFKYAVKMKNVYGVPDSDSVLFRALEEKKFAESADGWQLDAATRYAGLTRDLSKSVARKDYEAVAKAAYEIRAEMEKENGIDYVRDVISKAIDDEELNTILVLADRISEAAKSKGDGQKNKIASYDDKLRSALKGRLQAFDDNNQTDVDIVSNKFDRELDKLKGR